MAERDIEDVLKEYVDKGDQTLFFQWLMDCPYEVTAVRKYTSLKSVQIEMSYKVRGCDDD
tara:strand:- start:1196 stop:1375 length:180 start_codon:yes stop_codon:yes gene_type:complete